MIDVDRFRGFADRGDWTSLHAMLDDARGKATSRDDLASEVHWRIAAFERQGRYDKALEVLKAGGQFYNARCLVQHKMGRLLLLLDREEEALEELRKAPFEAEMVPFYALAIDAKFFYFCLLARSGDPSVADRVHEIPEDYEYCRRDGTTLMKSDILDAAKKRLVAGPNT